MNIFYNSTRLRAGWRVLVMLAMLAALLLALTFLEALLLHVFNWQPSEFAGFAIMIVVQFFAFSGAVLLAMYYLDTQPRARKLWTDKFLSLFGYDFGDLFFGLMIAFAMIGLVFVLMARLGWIQQVPAGQAQWLFVPLLVLVAVYEELVFRRYLLETIADGSNWVIGIVGSSILFGLAHSLNPGASLGSFLGISAAGMLIGYAYYRSGNLWLPIGLHFGWNFVEGFFFGFPTSGVAIDSLIKLQVSGPELWTGGAFGPEAGLIIVPGLLLGAVLVWLYTK